MADHRSTWRPTARRPRRDCVFFMQAGRHESAGANQRQWWGTDALYENTYARGERVWKIKVLNYRPVWQMPTSIPDGPRRDRTTCRLHEGCFRKILSARMRLQVPKPVLWPDTDVLEFRIRNRCISHPFEKNRENVPLFRSATNCRFTGAEVNSARRCPARARVSEPEVLIGR